MIEWIYIGKIWEKDTHHLYKSQFTQSPGTDCVWIVGFLYILLWNVPAMSLLLGITISKISPLHWNLWSSYMTDGVCMISEKGYHCKFIFACTSTTCIITSFCTCLPVIKLLHVMPSLQCSMWSEGRSICGSNWLWWNCAGNWLFGEASRPIQLTTGTTQGTSKFW